MMDENSAGCASEAAVDCLAHEMRDNPASTKCGACNGNGWRAVRNPHRLLPGVFEVDCETCGGHGWTVADEGARP